jgi:Fe-S-cluster containining protein
MPRHQSWKTLQLRGNRQDQEEKDMVAEFKVSYPLVARVHEVYGWLDSRIQQAADLAGVCDACGKCCNFAGTAAVSVQGPAPASEQGSNHLLFVTTPEVMYFAASLRDENIKPMLTHWCPYNISGKCSVYQHRFAGCRIFCCKADTDFQSGLSESAIKKFKSICTELHIPYRYTDLATALNGFASV